MGGGCKWTFRNYPDRRGAGRDGVGVRVHDQGLQEVRGALDRRRLRPRRHQVHQALPPKYEGAEILSEDYYKDSETDFRSVLSKIRRSGAQAIFLYGQADTTPIIARQMLKLLFW